MMWWSVAVGIIIVLALVVIALWGVYGHRFNVSLVLNAFKATPKTPEVAERKEPVFNDANTLLQKQQALDLGYTLPQLPPLDEHWQAVYCYVVQFFQKQVSDSSCFDPLKQSLEQRHIKVFLLLGFNENSQQWEISETQSSYRFWQVLMPLADRNGSLSRERIKLIGEECLRFAEKTVQRVKFPPLEGALERAKLLDDFCNEVDVVLNLRLVLNDPLSLEETQELLLRNYLNKEGKLFAYRLESEKLFTAGAQILPNNLVREIIFNLDAPRVSQPQRAFEDMVRCMQDIAELKQGVLYDRKDTRLTETDIGMIRGGIDQLAIQMTEKGVAPGSNLAHLLFS